MSTTRLSKHIKAPREVVYRTLLDPRAVPQWKVPDGMTCHVHQWDAREGGLLRVSLTYNDERGDGKSGARKDTYHGYFERLVPNECIVEIDEFEAEDPALRVPMTITITLTDADGGTNLLAVHEGVPAAVSPGDNELGWRMALDKLARLLESSR